MAGKSALGHVPDPGAEDLGVSSRSAGRQLWTEEGGKRRRTRTIAKLTPKAVTAANLASTMGINASCASASPHVILPKLAVCMEWAHRLTTASRRRRVTQLSNQMIAAMPARPPARGLRTNATERAR